jgi:hypothetical protein
VLIVDIDFGDEATIDVVVKYANLRTYWGLHLKNNVQKWSRSYG